MAGDHALNDESQNLGLPGLGLNIVQFIGFSLKHPQKVSGRRVQMSAILGGLGNFEKGPKPEEVVKKSAPTCTYCCHAYRMVTGVLNQSGWHMKNKQIERICGQEELKAPLKQSKKGVSV